MLVSLKDGTILCKAANAIVPGAIKKINDSKMPFKQMENISNFLKAARESFHMHESDLFTTADLFDGKSIVNVTNGIVSFSRAAEKLGFDKVESIAPKEARGSAIKKDWKINPNATVTKMTQGNHGKQEKTTIDMSRNPTFGADASKR